MFKQKYILKNVLKKKVYKKDTSTKENVKKT